MRLQMWGNFVNCRTKQIQDTSQIVYFLVLTFAFVFDYTGACSCFQWEKPGAFYLGVNRALFVSLWTLQLAYRESCNRLSPAFFLQMHATDSWGAILGEVSSLPCWMSEPVYVWMDGWTDEWMYGCLCMHVKGPVYTQRWYSPIPPV